MNTITDIETLYARLGERDYEAVMSYLADDIVWIVADNSPLADRSPYHGIADVRSGIFERLTAGFDKLVFDVDEIFECNGGERVVALGYYYFRFHGQSRGTQSTGRPRLDDPRRSGRKIPAISRHAPSRT